MVMPPNANEFEFSFFERSYLVGLFKTLQNSLEHRHNSLANRWAETLRIMLVQLRCFFLENSSVSRRLNVFHAPVQPGNAKCVRSPGSLAEPCLTHAAQHFIRRRKALD